MADTSVLRYELLVGVEECEFFCDRKYEIKSEKALVAAATTGYYVKIIELLNFGVLVDADEYNKLLLKDSKSYRIPLQLASTNGHTECVQILIDHGADVNAKNHFGLTAVHMAAERGHHMCLKALLDAGADCSLPIRFIKPGFYVTVPYPRGTTPLHLAARKNHVECVKVLIEYGADYNAIDELGHTSLYIATDLGFSECVLAHLKNVGGPDILSLPDFETADTPLHFAVSHRMVDCVRELLSLGSDVNHINNRGLAPLHMAFIPNENTDHDIEILKLLVLEGYNTDVNLPNSRGHTPLRYLCFGHIEKSVMRIEMAKFLIAYGANVDVTNVSAMGLIEYELISTDVEYDLLKCVVNSMLQLPCMEHLYFPSSTNSDFDPEDHSERVLMDKVLWYNDMALNARTLQHCCRYVVRQALGPTKLKDVGKLPIPAALKSYILLNYNA